MSACLRRRNIKREPQQRNNIYKLYWNSVASSYVCQSTLEIIIIILSNPDKSLFSGDETTTLFSASLPAFSGMAKTIKWGNEKVTMCHQ